MTDFVQHSPIAIKRYMEQIGILSANELAKKSGLPFQTIHNLLKNENPILKLSELEKIAQILFIPSVYLTDSNLEYKTNMPDIIDHRNMEDVFNSSYAYQSVIREALKARNDYLYVLETMGEEPLEFALTLSGQDEIEDAKVISNYFDLKNQKRSVKHNDYYSAWRSIFESKDILIIEKTTNEPFGSDGFCLWFDVVPVIVVLSTGQAAERRLFTIMHELVHLGLRQSVFDGKINTIANNSKTERYCDAVAGHVIAPIELLEACYQPDLSVEQLVQKIRCKAKASRPAIAIQLKLAGYITEKDLKNYLRSLDFKRIEKNKLNEPQIPISTRIISKYGRYFVQTVIAAMSHNSISASVAKDILGIKASHKVTTLQDVQKRVYM
ncbi:helix-turn-helix domain-containing protein [Acinetobacter lwoffii]|uniref:helix-turn-helix domain-containing protein n=1 Tax=Acinetobacter lwoffii TaxID=28090 RepID=UPI003BF675A8